jgi:cell division protein FtsB
VGIEEPAGRQRARRATLFTRTVVWVTALVCLAFLLGSLVQAWSNSQLMQNLLREQQATQQLQHEHAHLEQQASYYQDPYVIESEAREQLGYERPGEHVVVVVGMQNQKRAPASSSGKGSPTQGFWQAWWDLFFGNG